MRCPSCGARNADSAAWCSQCYASFEAPAPPDPAGTDETAPPRPNETAPSRPDDAPRGDEEPGDRRLRRSEDGVDWRCTSCDTWNPIERSACAVCGTQLAETFEDPAAEQAGADLAPATVVAASILLPGAGHVLLGRVAAGLGRLFLYLVWAGGGIALLGAAADADGSVLPALPLLTGAFVLLATSVLDAAALRRGDLTTEVLSARALLWLTVGVIGLTTLALIASALSVSA